jgi:hypothetical protein
MIRPLFSAMTALLGVVLMVLCSGFAGAQGGEGLLTTVGTTVERDGRIHAYILWQPGDAASTLGKRFAVHAKAGPADSPAPYQRLGIQTLQSSANTCRALLELGATVDMAAAAAPARIDGLYRDVTLRSADPPVAAADPQLDAAAKLAYLVQAAAVDERTLSNLYFLGRAHPAVMMALGHAFAVPVPAGVHTFEVREVDAAGGDIWVVGRVTLDTANPIRLEAPAAPFPVPHPLIVGDQHTVSPKDHLNVRLRWGVGPVLRAQIPHTFGFDVFRVKQRTAVDLGWHLSPPNPQEMIAAVSARDPADPDPPVVRSNELPVLVGDLLTPAEAADVSKDRFDFSDDGVWHRGPDGQPRRRPYSDGEAFYFFVAVRGITGAPGKISPGTLVVMCDVLPPQPPVVDSVLSQFVAPNQSVDWAAQGGGQFLQVKIRQLPETPASSSASGYFIYRWNTPQEYLDHIGNPVAGRIGYIGHQKNSPYRLFNDNGAGAPTLVTHADRSVWYTVRAVGRSACSQQVLSGHSAPMPGFLRDMKSPDGPGGDFLFCQHIPKVEFVSRQILAADKEGMPADYSGISVRATRVDSLVTGCAVEVSLLQADKTWAVVHSKRQLYQKSNTLRIDLPYREPENEAQQMRIRVAAVGANGRVSQPLERFISNAKKDPYTVHSYRLSVTHECRPISGSAESRPTHEAFAPSGAVTPVEGFITFSPLQKVREWRVYRRVGDDGELTLVAKAEGDSVPNPGTWKDAVPPAAAGVTVCYYGQLLDQNANPSPLTTLGCVTVSHADLPTPMLSPASVSGVEGDRMLVDLEWFCDPVGVDRFEILIAREGGGIPEIGGLVGPLRTSDLETVSGDLPDLVFHRYQTPRLGGSMGDGPVFGVQFKAPVDSRLYLAVRACGHGEPAERAKGSVSNVTSARWVDAPSGPQGIIPWPARPLPGVVEHRRAIGSYSPREGPLWPMVLPSDFGVPTGILVGLTRHAIEFPQAGKAGVLYAVDPPESFLFRVRESRENLQSLVPLMPFMLYRYQVPSALFPMARPNLVQCTPLLDRMSWAYEAATEKNPARYSIREPFFIFHPINNLMPLPVAGGWTDGTPPQLGNPLQVNPPPAYAERATGMILLKDPLPVTLGAKYRHLIVQFDGRGEIKQVLPLDPIQH